MSTTTAAPSHRKKKKTRTAHACEECRQRKRRCDGNYPCKCCTESLLVCKYAEILPPKVDRMFIELNHGIERLSKHQEALVSRIEYLEARLDHSVSSTPLLPRKGLHHSTAHSTSQFLRLVKTTAWHASGPYELLRLWPSLPPLLESAKVEVESDYVSKLESCEFLETTVPRSLLTLSDESSRHSPRRLSPAVFPPHDRSQLQPYMTTADIRALCAMYETHMYILLPFLDKQELRTILDNFINWRASQLSEHDRPVGRRHRSKLTDDLKWESTDKHPVGSCLEHALMYVVLALGLIFAHKGPLTAKSDDCHSHMLPMHINLRRDDSDLRDRRHETREASQSTAALSPSNVTWAESLAGSTLVGTSPLSGDSPHEASFVSLNIIHGSDEYTAAVETLENCRLGDDLLSAQIYLLMGLYNSQLALVVESMEWYTKAGKLLLLLLDQYNLHADCIDSQDGVEDHYHKTQARIKDKRHNLIVLASWTCLQLESDILVDLHLPSSGMQSIQHLLPLPLDMSGFSEHKGLLHSRTPEMHEDRVDLMIHFTAHSFLQKRLNIAHAQLHGPECLDRSLVVIRENLDGHQSILDNWRKQLPQSLKWSDLDPLPSDILAARLRATYWSAQHIVTRPFLDFALHILPHLHAGRGVEEVALDVSGKPRPSVEIQTFKAIQLMRPQEIWQACERCIEAAASSTVAFDGIEERLIVTNIHGTAHAQFCNMLVLAACWHDSRLRQLVEHWSFPTLLDRTIAFLGKLYELSPTCRADHDILVKLRTFLFGNGSNEWDLLSSDEYSSMSI